MDAARYRRFLNIFFVGTKSAHYKHFMRWILNCLKLGLFLGMNSLLACSHQPLAKERPPKVQRVLIQNQGSPLGNQSGPVAFGGLSDLVISTSESNSEKLILYTLSDRGPNGPELGGEGFPRRSFLSPEYNPQITEIAYDRMTGAAEVKKIILLKKSDGTRVTGLPNVDPQKSPFHFDEVPVSGKGEPLSFDPWGLDPEGLAQDDQGHFWISEEYGPSLLKIQKDGTILQRWFPQEKNSQKLRGGTANLPAFLAERRRNRGFEALVWTSNKTLLIFLQSGVPSQIHSDLAPVLEFDPLTERPIGLFFYPLSSEGGKIGAATRSANGEILVLEQNGEIGSKAWQKVFSIDFKSADNLISESLVKGSEWEIPMHLRSVQKTESMDLSTRGLESFEKLEGLTVTAENEIVVINDNDFEVGQEPNEFSKSYLFFLKSEY